MSRYEHEFNGITGGFGPMRGSDPNYRDGYQGMRMSSGGGRAAYGAHRMWREEDLGEAGGFSGIHGGHPRRGYEDHGRSGRYDEGTYRRQLGSYSGSGGQPQRGYGREMVRRAPPMPDRSWSPPRGYRPEYTNRGITDAGYSEGWARGPMRGAR